MCRGETYSLQTYASESRKYTEAMGRAIVKLRRMSDRAFGLILVSVERQICICFNVRFPAQIQTSALSPTSAAFLARIWPLRADTRRARRSAVDRPSG